MWGVVALVPMVLAGCGESDPLTLPPRPSTPDTTAPPAASLVPPPTVSGGTAPTVVTGEWVESTGSLAGLESECGNMSFVSARPDRDQLIAGVAARGLWSSTDGGVNWTALGVGDGSAQITNRTTAILYDPDAPSTFWESGIYTGPGVFSTTDDGQTFRQLGDVVHSERASVDFSDPQRRTLLSGVHERLDIFRSTDGGATWRNVTAGLPDDAGQATAPFVVDAETHLYGTRDGPGSGVFRTTDGGSTWERVVEGGVLGAPLVTSTGAILWLKEGGGGVVESTDDGATWTDVPGRTSAGAKTIIELPDGRLVTSADSFLIISSDNGRTWAPFGPALPEGRQPMAGFTYSVPRKAFYLWRFDCVEGVNPVAPDAIMRFDFDYEAA